MEEWKVKIAERENGDCEVETPFGRIDVLTVTKVIEVKHASHWKHAFGQVLIYGLVYPDREKWIYLFDWKKEDIAVINQACDQIKEIGFNVFFLKEEE